MIFINWPWPKLLLYSLVFGLVLLISPLYGTGADYVYAYRAEVNLWLQGGQLYALQGPLFHNPPWLAWLLLPFVMLPTYSGLALLKAISFVVLVYALDSRTQGLPGYTRLFTIVLGLINLIVFDLMNRGQIDVLALSGALLCLLPGRSPIIKGAGYLLLTLKPPNTLPLALYFFMLEVRNTSWLIAFKGLILPAGALVISFVLHGWWIGQLWVFLQTSPPYDTWRTTIWRATEMLQLNWVWPVVFSLAVIIGSFRLWRYARSTAEQMALIITSTFMITPYALSYHYIFILVFVFYLIIEWKMWVGIGLYSLTFLPVIRVLTGPEHSYIDLIFVIATYISLAIRLLESNRLSPGRVSHPYSSVITNSYSFKV